MNSYSLESFYCNGTEGDFNYLNQKIYLMFMFSRFSFQNSSLDHLQTAEAPMQTVDPQQPYGSIHLDLDQHREEDAWYCQNHHHSWNSQRLHPMIIASPCLKIIIAACPNATIASLKIFLSTLRPHTDPDGHRFINHIALD